jgi:competence protein ComGC
MNQTKNVTPRGDKSQLLLSLCFLMALLLGYWLGEHDTGLPLADVGIALVLMVLTFASCRGAPLLIVLVAMISCLFVLGFSWQLGARAQRATFNECVNNGEQVREQLTFYQIAHGHYPESLAPLTKGGYLACQLLLPPQLLRYKTTPTGYALYFGDDFVGFSATESLSFEGHK